MYDSITIRHFTQGDAPTLIDLINITAATDGTDITMSLQEFRREFGGPLARPERDILLAQHQDRVIATAWAWMEGRENAPNAAMPLLLYVHPDYRSQGVGERLVDMALAQGRGLGAATAISPAQPQDPYKRDLLQAKGFTFSRPWYLMQASLPEVMDVGPLQAGFRAHAYRGCQDDAPLIALINDIFATAYLDRVYTVADMHHWTSDSGFDSNLLKFLTTDNGSLAGYVWSWGDPSPDEDEERAGFIGDLGLREAYRGRGLGRWLLRRAMADLRERGMDCADLDVDGTNSQARRLYDSEGFQVREEIHWYETRLRGDSDA